MVESIESESQEITKQAEAKSHEIRQSEDGSLKIRMDYGEFKQCTLNIRFPTDYPIKPVELEMRSV